MAATAEAISASHVGAGADPLDIELGFLVEVQLELLSSTDDLDGFKAEMRPLVEGAAAANGEAFGKDLLRRFDQLTPLELIALGGIADRDAVQTLTASNPDFGKTESAKQLRRRSRATAKQASRQFRIPIWSALLGRSSLLGRFYRGPRGRTRSRRSSRRQNARASSSASRDGPDEPHEPPLLSDSPARAGRLGVGEAT